MHSFIHKDRGRFFVRGAFIRFYIPALLSSFWLAVAGVADSVFVGNGVGSAGLAAISLGQPVYLFYNILSYGFSIGGSIHYASRMAEGRAQEANRIFITILRLLLTTYIVTACLGLLLQPQLMRVLGADPADPVTFTYIRTQLIFVPIMFCQGPFYFFVNADNGPKTAAAAMSVSGITDAIFSYIFVMRMGLGVAGSVYSTVVGALLMLMITGWHIVSKKGALHFRWESHDWNIVRRSARTGFSTSVHYLFQFITMIAVNRILIKMGGAVAVAAFDVVYNISLLCQSIADGAIVATEPMISSYRSERNIENIRLTMQYSLRWSTFLSLAMAVIFAVFSPQFSVFFGMKEGVELIYASEGIRIFALSVLPAMLNMLFGGYYQTLLKERLAYLITFLRSFVFYLMALYMSSKIGMSVFWYIFTIVEVLTILVWIPLTARKGGILQLKDIDVTNVKTVVVDSADQNITKIIEDMQAFAEERGAGPREAMYIGLTVEEICCAIIERFRDHMEGIYVQVTVVVEDNDTTLYLRDNAYEFNPLGEDTNSISLEEGRALDLVGLQIVQKKAKEFYYRRYSGFNTLVIRL